MCWFTLSTDSKPARSKTAHLWIKLRIQWYANELFVDDSTASGFVHMIDLMNLNWLLCRHESNIKISGFNLHRTPNITFELRVKSTVQWQPAKPMHRLVPRSFGEQTCSKIPWRRNDWSTTEPERCCEIQNSNISNGGSTEQVEVLLLQCTVLWTLK